MQAPATREESGEKTLPRSELTASSRRASRTSPVAEPARKRPVSRSSSPVSDDQEDARSVRRAVFPKRPVTAENKVLAIFGLHLDVTEQELDGLYRPYGATFTKIIVDKRSSASKGYGFIYFDRTAEAVKAKNATEGLKLRNKEFRLDYSLGERDYSQMIVSRRSPPRALPPPRPFRRDHEQHTRAFGGRHEPRSFAYDRERRQPDFHRSRSPLRHSPPRHRIPHRHFQPLPAHESYRARDDPRYMTLATTNEMRIKRDHYDYREEPFASRPRFSAHSPNHHHHHTNGGRSAHSQGSSSSGGRMTPPESPARRGSRSRSRSRREVFHVRA